MDIDIVCNPNNLYNAFYKSRASVYWKESVQRYEMNLLLNILKTQESVLDRTYKPKKLSEFELHERGRVRQIKAHHISDRVLQRSLNDNVLVPRVRKKLIYDNGASLVGKGVGFARKRFELHLRKAYKKHTGCYIILLDFSKYFDNIRHDIMLNLLKDFVDDSVLKFLEKVFKEFEIDVSYMTDEEFDNCLNVLFNATEYSHLNSEKCGERFMKKSLGIGNHTSQICGVLYPNRLDNFIKIVKGIKYYGRYMDDTYIMVESKEKALELYEEIKIICKDLGIFLNEKKTRIRKLTNWNTFLKVNYKILESGRLIRKIANSNIRRWRRKIKTYRKLLDKGIMTFEGVLNSFKSTYGTYKKYDSGYKLLRVKNYFKELFAKELKDYGKSAKARRFVISPYKSCFGDWGLESS